MVGYTHIGLIGIGSEEAIAQILALPSSILLTPMFIFFGRECVQVGSSRDTLVELAYIIRALVTD